MLEMLVISKYNISNKKKICFFRFGTVERYG